LLQLEQRWIQSALVECKLIPADLFDSPRDPIPVQRTQGLQGLDDHQTEAAVENVTLVGRHVWGAYISQLLAVNWSDGSRFQALWRRGVAPYRTLSRCTCRRARILPDLDILVLVSFVLTYAGWACARRVNALPFLLALACASAATLIGLPRNP
jgi:hypothetical protein